MRKRCLQSRTMVFAHLIMVAGATAGTPYAGIAQAPVASDARSANALRAAEELLARPVTLNLTRVSLTRAIDAAAASAHVLVQYQVPAVEAYGKSVTMHLTNVTLRTALDRVLAGTRLHVVPDGTTQLTIVDAGSGEVVNAQGIILGTVIDAKTKRPVHGAVVTIDGDTRGGNTDEEGRYRLTGVSVGERRITVKSIGYTQQTRIVSVSDDRVVTVDIVLQPSVSVLDQVVVTGTIIPTELKAVPNAMTVITAKQIEERGITHIDQLFRGDVPGLFVQNLGSAALLDEVTMFSRGTTSLNLNDPVSGAFTPFTNPIKTYVDGVELADPKYLSQIDPKSIERIEILTGPQASTIYGSNAINGVMQIFTKRGSSSTPQLTLNLMSGWVENNFSSAHTPQHDYSAQWGGLEGRLSYNAGASWNYMGPWTPAKQLARTSGFGGARLEVPTSAGRVTADVTLRRSLTQSVQHGAVYQAQTAYRETGWWTNNSSSGLAVPATRTVTGQTLGVTLSYVPTSWWSHELGLGQDASDTEQRYTARGYASVSDTTLFLQQTHTDRRSFNYSTTVRIPIGTSSASLAQATVIAGADAWQSLTALWKISPQTLTGSLTGSTSMRRQPGHNVGGFLQSQLGFKDHLFLTYGLRAEWNPGFGAEAQPNYAPRYGVAYTQDVATPLGSMTAKLRGSYGRSTRPPSPGLKAAQTIADYYASFFGSSLPSYVSQFYPPFDHSLANPALGPEHQQGGEGGLELYFGTRGSLVITRYNQTVDGLIAAPKVDSVRSLTACQIPPSTCTADGQDVNGYGYEYQIRYLNIGSIRNQGWELQGSVPVGPFTTRGTYSWTRSRTIGVNPKYRTFFDPINYPQYQPGATFQFLPEHTWALGITYAHASSSVGLNLTGAGQVMNSADDLYFRSLLGSVRLPQNRLNVSTVGSYVNFNNAYALADFTASHRFLPDVEGVLQVQNLTNRYTNDYYAAYASLGRQVKLGARVRTQ